jgi:uncharacterized membrane protein YGL010W
MTLVDQLARYAAYHRDRRNIATHMIGVPLIVVAVEILLSRPHIVVGPVACTPAMLLSVATALFYLRLDVAIGALMALLLGLAVWAGLHVAALPTGAWLAAGLGGFVIGWIIQLVGHIYEGRKPAFVDDIVGLLIGPLFVVAEILVAFGMRPDLRDAIAPARGR